MDQGLLDGDDCLLLPVGRCFALTALGSVSRFHQTGKWGYQVSRLRDRTEGYAPERWEVQRMRVRTHNPSRSALLPEGVIFFSHYHRP